jgi:hypothetical protein
MTEIGVPASASARPQRSEESQADGRPRPTSEGPRMKLDVLRMRRIPGEMTILTTF